ncbi:MAG: P-loop NTPase fold protein [Psychrilyobacter sp.]|uniref:P-loop NTPase fold protein n=1 Tax=Psychrilyobacter sp. TaxID=2586924 RepID=UPI003C75038E
MKKMKWINFICYVLITYILSSLYGIIFRLTVPEILKFEYLFNLNILFLALLIIGYLLSNYFKSIKEVFESGAKKASYVLVFILGVNTNNIALIYAVSICLIGANAVLFVENRQIKKNEKNDESKKELELYPSRRNLMDVLNHALGEYSLIALDGSWGSGKTTFMNIVMRENREKYYYIPINVMLFENRNSLKTEFLNQLKGIFKEEGIFQGSLMDFDYYLDGVSNDWVKVVKNIIFSKSKSFKEANEKLKSEIGKIEKRIVVGVDNLERIYGKSEPEWKQILGFINELQELGIKIVVMANLEEMLTTKKETGEKDLSNYEYFDKFYEFKLQLNEVTTEEIIDEVEIKENGIKMKKDEVEKTKEWLKDGFKWLTDGLKQKEIKIKQKRKDITEGEVGKNLAGNPSVEERVKRKIEVETKEKPLLELLQNLMEKYYKNSKNPRKVEKIIQDMRLKEKIEDIHNFEKGEYKKLIFITAIFQQFYFDYYYRFKREGVFIFNDLLDESDILYNDYPIEDIFLDFIKVCFKNNIQAVNRLLYSEPEDENVKNRIENLNDDSVVTENSLGKYLENIKIYSQRLDGTDMKVTKEKYTIIQNKLIRLEKINKEKIHNIIKENEEFICKMNYSCDPNSYKFYKESSYKFDITKIMNQYESSLKKLFIILEYKKEIVEEKGRILSLEKFQEIVGEYLAVDKLEVKQSTPSELEELKMQIKNKNHPKFKLRKKVEESISKDLISVLDILNEEFDKVETVEEESIESKVQDWKDKEINKKNEILNEMCLSNNTKEQINFNVEKCKKILKLLEGLLKDENNREVLFFMDDIISGYKNYIFNTEIKERITNFYKKQNSKNGMKKIIPTKEESKEIIEFVNESRKNDPCLIIFGDNYPNDKDVDEAHTINYLERIGIIRNENGFDLKDNFK